MLTITDVVEYCFCPKFAYFMLVLGLEQFEQKRGTVQAGKKMHEKYEKTNRAYVPSFASGNNVRKFSEKTMHSKKYGYVGKLDQAFLVDGKEFVLLETKHSDYHKVGEMLRTQIGLLSVLVEENFGIPAKKCVVVFTKGDREVVDVEIDDDLKRMALANLEKTKALIRGCVMPEAEYDHRCVHCCYNRVCSTGSLNTGA